MSARPQVDGEPPIHLANEHGASDMATRTGNYMNWVNVSVLPPTGTAINVTEVTDFAPELSNTNEKFYGDNRRFAKLIRSTMFERKVSITTGDVAAANAIPYGLPCTITATLCDALNGTGAGAINYTLKNCVMDKNGVKAANNKFGEVTISFDCFSDDSSATDTDPFSYVVATGS